MKQSIARNIFYVFLILNILGIWYFSYIDYPYFHIETIQDFLVGQNLYIGLAIYMCIMMLRGLTLIPGTPLLILGAIIFPTIHAIIAIAIAVQLYVVIIHKYSNVLNFEIPKKIESSREKIEKYGISYIILICLIPGMSMNILAYFLSILKVPLSTKMLGIGIGSFVNLCIYLHLFETIFQLTT